MYIFSDASLGRSSEKTGRFLADCKYLLNFSLQFLIVCFQFLVLIPIFLCSRSSPYWVSTLTEYFLNNLNFSPPPPPPPPPPLPHETVRKCSLWRTTLNVVSQLGAPDVYWIAISKAKLALYRYIETQHVCLTAQIIQTVSSYFLMITKIKAELAFLNGIKWKSIMIWYFS